MRRKEKCVIAIIIIFISRIIPLLKAATYSEPENPANLYYFIPYRSRFHSISQWHAPISWAPSLRTTHSTLKSKRKWWWTSSTHATCKITVLQSKANAKRLDRSCRWGPDPTALRPSADRSKASRCFPRQALNHRGSPIRHSRAPLHGPRQPERAFHGRLTRGSPAGNAASRRYKNSARRRPFPPRTPSLAAHTEPEQQSRSSAPLSPASLGSIAAGSRWRRRSRTSWTS